MSYVRNFIDSSTIFTIRRTVVGAVLFSITIAGVLTMLLLRPTTWVVTDTSTAESPAQAMRSVRVVRFKTSAANRLIGEDVQSRRRPLLGPSPG